MRSGMAMVLVMALVLLCAFFTGVFFFLARGETDRTVVQAREIQATIIGEGVAARIGTLVDSWPWAGRFYKQMRDGASVYAFTHQRFPFDLRHGPFANGEASFTGFVKDLPVAGSYRILVEVSYQGQRVLMTFDRAYPQGVLSVSTQDAGVLAGHASPADRSVIDQLVDRTRDAARNARGDEPFRQIDYLSDLDATLTDRRSGRNPGREILWGRGR
jgi:hypothetical protein